MERRFLRSVAFRVGRIWQRVISKVGRFSDEDLWNSYQSQVEAAKTHPKVNLLDWYFLYPTKLSAELRQQIQEHLGGCPRCREVGTYYRQHEDLFRRRKDEPCD